MTFEPLKNKLHKLAGHPHMEPADNNDVCAWWFHKNDVKSAVGFYKKYKYHLDLLKEKEPEAFKEWCNSSEYTYFKKEIENGNPLLAEEYYRDWLFNYSFQDVI